MMRKAVIVKVTEAEFEAEDGGVFPHPAPFEKDQVPSVEEFQEWYDHWYNHFKEHGTGEGDNVEEG